VRDSWSFDYGSRGSSTACAPSGHVGRWIGRSTIVSTWFGLMVLIPPLLGVDFLLTGGWWQRMAGLVLFPAGSLLDFGLVQWLRRPVDPDAQAALRRRQEARPSERRTPGYADYLRLAHPCRSRTCSPAATEAPTPAFPWAGARRVRAGSVEEFVTFVPL
jgi:hypothetical protein